MNTDQPKISFNSTFAPRYKYPLEFERQIIHLSPM